MVPFPTTPRFWTKWSDHELRVRKDALDAIAYRITQQKGTEAPHSHPDWNPHTPGLYMDVVSGEPLFCSLDGYHSGSGWPSFVQPIEPNAVHYTSDHTLDTTRTEVISSIAQSHLGHVFDDGPYPHRTRYCINGHALTFIPKAHLAQKGYGDYTKRFVITLADQHAKQHIAVFACGCFWSVQALFNRAPGVIASVCGYTGGNDQQEATYKNVCSGTTGHAEAVLLYFDPHTISYETLVKMFFKMHNPTTRNQQGNDVGTQYRSAIFYTNTTQQQIANDVIAQANHAHYFSHPIVTELCAFDTLHIAECLHQHYLDNFPDGYHCHRIDDRVFPTCTIPLK